MMLKDSVEANTLKKHHVDRARHGLAMCKAWRLSTLPDARRNRNCCLTGAVANTWLAIGVHRYEESYNEHGVRI